MYYLLENYGSDPAATYLVNNREIYCVPIVNSDGYFHHERKNRRQNPDSSIGVDLNRNFGYMWGIDDVGSKPGPSHIMYRGPYAFSEPESHAIRDFCNSHEFIIANNMHYYGYWLYVPYGYNISPTPDSTIFDKFTSLAVEVNGYNPQNSFNRVNGTVADWMYGDTISKPKIFAITTEVGGQNISSYVNPTNEDILNTCRDGVYQNEIICLAPGIAVDVPLITNINLDKHLIVNQDDYITITVEENNSTNPVPSIISAIVFNDQETAIDSILLEYDHGNNNSYWIGQIKPPELEGFYSLKVLQQIGGTSFPISYGSNFKKLIFTNAGPVTVEMDNIEPRGNSGYKMYFNVRNMSDELALDDIYLNISTPDSSIRTITPSRIVLHDIEPGETALSPYSIIIVDSSFSKELNLFFEIEYNDFVFWLDTLSNYLITDLADNNNLPGEFKLYQNFPNPFNPATKIGYYVPRSSFVLLKIYNSVGSEIKTLVSGNQHKGKHSVVWDGTNSRDELVPSSVYFYRLSVDGNTVTRKMVLLK